MNICDYSFQAKGISDCALTLTINDLYAIDGNYQAFIVNSLGNVQILDCTVADGSTTLDLLDLPVAFLSTNKLYTLYFSDEIIYNTVFLAINFSVINVNPIIENEYIH